MAGTRYGVEVDEDGEAVVVAEVEVCPLPLCGGDGGGCGGCRGRGLSCL